MPVKCPSLEFSHWKAKLILCFYILGWFVPFFWISAIFFKNEPNETVQFFFRLSMYGFVAQVLGVFFLFWAACVFFWNFPLSYNAYVGVMPILPGEILACIYFPIMAIVVLWDIISRLISDTRFKKIKNTVVRKINQVKNK
eukprot:gene9885-2207_t